MQVQITSTWAPVHNDPIPYHLAMRLSRVLAKDGDLQTLVKMTGDQQGQVFYRQVLVRVPIAPLDRITDDITIVESEAAVA